MKRWLISALVVIVVASGLLFSGCGIQDKKQRSGLQIETGNGQTVAVYLNGSYINQTPLIEKELRPGFYSLKLVPTNPAFVSYEETIELHPGTITWVVWNPGPSPETSGGTILEVEPLQKQQAWWEFWKNENSKSGELVFSSIPENAIVTVDKSSDIFFTPTLLTNLTDDSVSFTVTLPSYETQAHTIDIKPGYKVNVMSKLAKKDAVLAETAQPTVLGTDVSNQQTSASESASKILILPTNYRVGGKEVLRVRSGPDANAATLDYIEVGTTASPAGEISENWIKINLATQSGWINRSFSKEITATESAVP